MQPPDLCECPHSISGELWRVYPSDCQLITRSPTVLGRRAAGAIIEQPIRAVLLRSRARGVRDPACRYVRVQASSLPDLGGVVRYSPGLFWSPPNPQRSGTAWV